MYGAEIRDAALEQVQGGISAAEIARQLGVHRNTIQNWVQAARKRGSELAPATEWTWQRKIEQLQVQVGALEGTVGRQAMEIRFFKGALRRVEESRRQTNKPGGTASTPKSKA